MDRSMTRPLPIGAVPPIGVPVPGPPGGGGGGGGADALDMITGTIINSPIRIRFDIAFFIKCNFFVAKIIS
jgi:hypothetical protein